MTTPPPTVGRRRLLAGLPVALIAGAGCLGQTVSDDLLVRNLTDEQQTVSLDVATTDGTDLFAETVTIPAQEERRFENPLPPTGQFTVTVSVEGGPSEETFWESEDEGDQLSIRLTDAGIEFDASGE
ncbi:hypothetical protein [Salinirubrum litoreum]|uniref:Ig-like domain-containing protein n=1 Tax=Salinirubrum litoreum TaxID=1126234 RepID=A0ABD5RE32_9EURY|nr:hypothetical protein [Salinirubrum litoreum]